MRHRPDYRRTAIMATTTDRPEPRPQPRPPTIRELYQRAAEGDRPAEDMLDAYFAARP